MFTYFNTHRTLNTLKHQSFNPFQDRLPPLLCVGMKVFIYYQLQKCNGMDSFLDPGGNE